MSPIAERTPAVSLSKKDCPSPKASWAMPNISFLIASSSWAASILFFWISINVLAVSNSRSAAFCKPFNLSFSAFNESVAEPLRIAAMSIWVFKLSMLVWAFIPAICPSIA